MTSASEVFLQQLLISLKISLCLEYRHGSMLTFEVQSPLVRLKPEFHAYISANKETVCFSDPEETEIPALQRWCHALTLPARADNARLLVQSFLAFALDLKSFLEFGTEGVAERDRGALKAQWASKMNETASQAPSREARVFQAKRSPMGVTSHLTLVCHRYVNKLVHSCSRNDLLI